MAIPLLPHSIIREDPLEILVQINDFDNYQELTFIDDDGYLVLMNKSVAFAAINLSDMMFNTSMLHPIALLFTPDIHAQTLEIKASLLIQL